MKCKNCTIWACPRRRDGEQQCYYEEKKAAYEDVYWYRFRAEAAKDFVSIMCNHRYDTKEERYPVICKEAIALADELIKQLKEKEEK